jgi:hypothetical protein
VPVDTTFEMRVRLDTDRNAEYFRHGGITPYVMPLVSQGAVA